MSAVSALQAALWAREQSEAAAIIKGRRDSKVAEAARPIRTYHLCRGTVKDHRTGAVATVKEVLEKGHSELLTRDLFTKTG